MESDHERIERLAQTIDSSRKQKIENKDDSIVKEESVYSVKSEEYKIEETWGKRVKDHRPGMEAFHNDNDNDEPTGINMKGKSIDFQDSCIALKHHLKRGKYLRIMKADS